MRMASTLPVETAESDHELEMRYLKRSILETHSYRSFLKGLMRQSAKRDEGWESAAEELADIWESRRSRVPWYAPGELDVRRAAFELMEFFWPIFMEWREGFVDQSELHILVRSGGMDWVEGEGERIDVAVIGHCDGGLIVEFLPMFGVDPDAAMAAKRHAVRLLDLVATSDHPDGAWGYAMHHCGTAANAYSEVRFVGRAGRKAVRYLNEFDAAKRGSVPKQAPRIEGIGHLGRFAIYSKDTYVGLHLIQGETTIKGRLVHLTHDCVAIILRRPLYGGCVMRTIFAPYSSGYLIDERGLLTEFGAETVVELVHQMHQTASAMASEIIEVKRALARASRQLQSGEVEIEASAEAWFALVHESLSGPLTDIDLELFKSVLDAWLARDEEGTIGDPGTWNED
jgi:hypothetical protein